MADGSEKRIADVRVGEFVVSHRGITRVDASLCTGVKNIVEIVHENGVITCTSDHPFGIIRPSGIEYLTPQKGDELCTLGESSLNEERRLNWLSGAGKSGEDIQTQKAMLAEITTTDASERMASSCTSCCTEKCGNSQTEISQKDMISITLTETQQTTKLKTCVQSPAQSTQSCIRKRLVKQSRLLQNGTSRKLEGNGTGNTQSESQTPCSFALSTASNAEKHSKQKTEETSDTSVVAHAKQNGDETTKSITSPSHVKFAALSSGPTNTTRSLPVLQPAKASKCLSVRETGRTEAVYNLATSDGTFYANGVLSSNCDAARYLLFTHAYAAGATIESIRRNSQMRDAVDDYSVPVNSESVIDSYAVNRRAEIMGAHRKRDQGG